LFLCFFVSFLVSLLARLGENGWTDLHEISGKVRSDHDLIQFWVNSEKPRDAAMRNTGTGFCFAFAPQLVHTAIIYYPEHH